MKIVVIGGTGLIGSGLVTKLKALGHEAVAAAPNTGVNTLTGEGLAEVLKKSQVVVDVSNSPSFEDAAVMILIVTMVIRRTPVRVTPNPWFWLLAFVASYGVLAFTAFAPSGVMLVSPVIVNVLVVLSAVVFIYARLSLGRSIGFVPANRGIITRGAYRFVRHPIYTGIFIAELAFVLRSYSLLNLILASIIVALFMIKSIVEESFLSGDPEYATYLQRVRWRWIPGVA